MTRSRKPFGARLEEEMANADITQADLARTLDISQQTVSKWITGETSPRPRHVPKLEELFGLERGTLALLLFAPEAPEPIPDPKRPMVNMAALNRRIGKLNPNELVKLEGYVDGLLDNRR